MKIDASSQGFSITKALRCYLSDKLESKLKKYDHRIDGIHVSMTDVNGPKGGADKKCTLSIKLDHKKHIVVQKTAKDMYDAIDICAQKAKHATSRQIDRLQWRKNRGPKNQSPDYAYG